MFRGGKKVVGLDVGSSQVKAIELKKTGNRLELVHLGVSDVYPGGDRSSAMSSDPFQLKVNAIQQAIRNAGISAKHTVSAISDESIIVRFIQFQEMPAAEMSNALRWEAEEYIPYSIDEVNLDSVVLGPSASPGKVDVLLVSARKDLVNDHVQLIRSAQLIPHIVDVEGFAFLNCFEINYEPTPDECVCLVHIGAEITNINIYVANSSRFSRDISLAGNAITEAVSQKCQVSWAEAENLKVTVGALAPEDDQEDEGGSELISSIRGTVERITGSDLGEDTPENTASRAIQNTLSQLVSEVRRSIQFFEGQAGGTTIQRVIVGGGTAKMPNLAPFLQSELEVAVEIIDPLRKIQIGRDVDKNLLEVHREQLGAGIGLALRKVID